MVNFDGNLVEDDTRILGHHNRGLKYGDGLFETMRCIHGKIFFWEDHYFRLMASMRILRMEIPMTFTLEFLEEQILQTVKANGLGDSAARVRLTVFRKSGGLYRPETNDIAYILECHELDAPFYLIPETHCQVELFKDFYVNRDMLSNLKTTNKLLNVVASVYAQENGYDNCLLINTEKQVVEAINGNLFLVKDSTIKTPPLMDGCLDGIIRKKLKEIITKMEEIDFQESSISPFELQQADELFITNSIVGILPITRYRKKQYGGNMGKNLLGKLNALARLG
ncbi:aminotransferase class IV [Flagellimonas meishanensis]|uniref:aminotransferase class IV n=1 Tax=Flagellimonas meishanensis TaxID=2873264 RepID=UPI001CA6AA10|nr:aminotransferase class IV [[Muricauda] meishanensis]